MKNTNHKTITFMLAGILVAGCIVATRYETLRGSPSLNYSGSQYVERYTKVQGQQGMVGEPYLLKIGNTRIYFASIRLSSDVVSAGPVLPVIPIPDKPVDYEGNFLTISMFAWPEEGAISFYPDQFQVIVNQSGERLSPRAVLKQRSFGAYVFNQSTENEETLENTSGLLTIKKSRIDAATVWPRYSFVFDVRLKDIQEFTLVPAIMFLDGKAYLLPDLEYKRYSHTTYD